MHKALEILKNPMAIISANENHVYSKKQIEQVIVELEEAMKPKTCDGCKHKPNDGECYYEPLKSITINQMGGGKDEY